MNPLWSKWLRRTLAVGVLLAFAGFGLAKAFLFTHQIYAGDSYNEENERVLWQTPIIMAGLGMFFSGGLEALAMLVRKPVPVPSQVPPSVGNGS